jgi:hypothetical protein
MLKRKTLFMAVLVIGLLGLSGVVCTADAQKSDSFIYVGKADGFAVEVPKDFKDFKYSSEPMDTALGKKENHIYKSTAKTMGFTIFVTDYGMKNIKEADAKKLTEIRMAGTEKRGKVLSKSKNILAGKPALVLFDMIDAKGQKVFSETWFAFIDGKMFQLSYMTTNTKLITNPAARKFFSSFKYPVK